MKINYIFESTNRQLVFIHKNTQKQPLRFARYLNIFFNLSRTVGNHSVRSLAPIGMNKDLIERDYNTNTFKEYYENQS